MNSDIKCIIFIYIVLMIMELLFNIEYIILFLYKMLYYF